MTKSVLLCSTLVPLFALAAASASITGSISGVVTDKSGAVLLPLKLLF